jgi:hypothetical protein
MKRNIEPTTMLAVIVLAVFVAAAVPSARADGGCSLANLNGTYAVSRQGTLVTSILGLPAPAPWGEVARADFNGAGTLSATVALNIGGAVINGNVTGTYTVNSDCTGTITVHPTGYPITITQAIVVIDGGHYYIATDTESFAVVQGRGERLGD